MSPLWENSKELPSGTALAVVRKSGFYIISDATDAPLAGEWHVLVLNGVSGGDRRTYQLLWSVDTGEEYFRTLDDEGYSDWAVRSGGGGGGPTSAALVSFNNVASGLTATNVQTALDEIVDRIEASEADISSLELQLDAINTALTNLAAADTAFDERMDAAEADIASLQTTMGELQDSVDNVNLTVVSMQDKLNGIEDGAEVNPTNAEIVAGIDTELGSDEWRTGGAGAVTDLGTIVDADSIEVTSSTGANATLNGATTGEAGLLTAADKLKLDGIEVGAEVNPTNGEIVTAINDALGSTEWQNAPSGSSATNATVRLAATNNIALPAGLIDGASVDTFVLVAGDIVMLAGQANPAENGIYIAGPTPTRHTSYDTFTELAGLLVTVQQGAVNEDTVWLCTSEDGGVIGTDPIEFAPSAVVPTNLSMTRNNLEVQVNSSTGSAAAIPGASTTNAGVMTAADKAKLDGIEAGAKGDQTASEIVDLLNAYLGSDDWQEGGSPPVSGGGVSSAFLVRRSATQAIPATFTDVSFPTEVYDPDNTFLTATWTPSTSGVAIIACSVSFARADASSSIGDVRIQRTSTNTTLAQARNNNIATNNVALTCVIEVTAGQSFRVQATGGSGTGGNISHATFSGCVLGSGAGGGAGDDGDNGWSPVFAIEVVDDVRYLKVISWTGGTGLAPSAPRYLGTSGFVDNIEDAVAFAGGTGGGGSAAETTFDPSVIGIVATNVQEAIEELFASIGAGAGTDISVTVDDAAAAIHSNTGDTGFIPSATVTEAGVMSAADKAKLDGIAAGAQVNPDGADMVAAIDDELGSEEWREPERTPAEIITAINDALGSTAWQNAAPGGEPTNTSVRVVAGNTNIDIATALNVGDTVNGVVLADGDRVLVAFQTNPVQNGIYLAGAVPTRSPDYDTFVELAGVLITVQEGTSFDDTVWLCTSDDSGTIDVDPLTFVQTAITPTNLSMVRDALQVQINSSTGSGVAVPAATSTLAGLMTPAQFTKLAGIENNATADMLPAEIVTAINAALGGTDWQEGGSSGGSPRSFRAVKTSGNQATNANLVKVLFNSETSDPDGTFNPTNSRWTPGVAGIVVVMGSIYSSTAAARYSLQIRKNGVALPGVTTGTNSGIVVDICDANDYYEIWGSAWTLTVGPNYVPINPNAQTFFTGAILAGAAAGAGAADLSVSRTSTNVTVNSSTGTDALIPAADTDLAGMMTAVMFDKLAGIEAGAEVNPTASEIVAAINAVLGSSVWQGGAVGTNLDAGADADSVAIQSDTGDDAVIGAATTTLAGVMSAADKTKLDGIESGAEANPTPTEIVSDIDAELGSADWRTGGGGGATDLDATADADSVTVASSTGDDAVIVAATTSAAGVMSAADKTKLDGVEAGAEVNPSGAEIASSLDTELGSSDWRTGGAGVTDLSVAVDGTSVTVESSTGDDAVIDAATTTDAGVMSAADKSKLDGIEAGAQANPGSATTSVPGLMSATDKTKLDGIQSGAQVNPGNATTSTSGLMSSTDKTKLDGIQAGAQVNPGVATSGSTGLMSSTDKSKLDGIEAGAEVNPTATEIVSAIDGQLGSSAWQTGGATNITVTPDADSVAINSSSGTDADFPAATTSTAGAMTAADKTKLDGIAAGAQVNPSASAIVSAINSELGSTTWQGGGGVPAASDVSVVALPTLVGDDVQAVLEDIDSKLVGRQSIYVPAGSFMPRMNNPPAVNRLEMTTNRNMLHTHDFSNSVQQFSQLEFGLPKGWDQTAGLTFTPVWSHAATSTNFAVEWAFAAVAQGDGDVIDAAFGTEVTSLDGGGATNTRYIGPETAVCTPAGTPQESDVVMIQITRHVSGVTSNMAIPARMHGIWVHGQLKSPSDD
jgi:hypothetical protein